jgi:murein DD-endopeptidase MepM/ murein hydrolase activator NlpD
MDRKVYFFLVTLILPTQNSQLITQLPRVDNIPEFQCPAPILSRLETHVIGQGETLEGIAENYGLLPETLIRLNSILEQNPLPIGASITIPPFNGIKIEVPPGVTWRELAKAYGVRQEVLFELNGCQKMPKTVFIPGISWYSSPSNPPDYTGVQGYPLPTPAQVGLNYGWHTLADSQQRFFHSGVDLLAPVGTGVLSVEDGIVVLIGNEGNYGFLVIINHPGGRQTRYAHLSKVNVKIDSEVKAGDLIGEVGTTGQPDIDSPHLHFEVRYQTPQGWIAQDPLIHLPQHRN